MTQFCSVFVCLGMPLGPGVLLVRVLRSQVSAGTSWPFKALCGHSQKQLVVLQMFLQFVSEQLLFPSFVCFSFIYQIPEEG